jgi:hypothetical protein
LTKSHGEGLLYITDNGLSVLMIDTVTVANGVGRKESTAPNLFVTPTGPSPRRSMPTAH